MTTDNTALADRLSDAASELKGNIALVRAPLIDLLTEAASALRGRESVVGAVEGTVDSINFESDEFTLVTFKVPVNTAWGICPYAISRTNEDADEVMVLVPREATEEMLQAVPWMGPTSAADIYRAMIKAVKGGEE